MRWIRVQGAAVVVMLATIHQVRHSVLLGTQVATLASDAMCTIVMLAHSNWLVMLMFWYKKAIRCLTVGGVINCAQHIRPIWKGCPKCNVVLPRLIDDRMVNFSTEHNLKNSNFERNFIILLTVSFPTQMRMNVFDTLLFVCLAWNIWQIAFNCCRHGVETSPCYKEN